MITLIAAVNHNMLLGKDNNMPWHVKEDLQFFKQQTLHKHVLMGRKTFESLPSVLKDRTIYLLTTNKDFQVIASNVHLVFDINQLIERFKQSKDTLMVAGGGEIYKQMMPYAQTILLSKIDDHQHGDVYFPSIDLKVFKKTKTIEFEQFSVEEYQRYV